MELHALTLAACSYALLWATVAIATNTVPFFLEVLKNQSFLACPHHPSCKKCAQVVTKYRVEYSQAIRGV